MQNRSGARPQKRRPPAREVDGIVLLDKPLGLSSNAALQQVKRIYNAAKAGHTGSLDPLATGLLPICLGETTKLSAYLLDADKTYIATVRLGEATTTGDAEGEVVARSDPRGVTLEALERCIPQLLGPQQQVPPMYSALKRDGLPLYALARAGVEVEREPRSICIEQLRVLEPGLEVLNDAPCFQFEVRCSKGTYVRTLAEDWAAQLGQSAHLIGLRRTALGRLTLAQAVSSEALQAVATDVAALDRYLTPSIAGLADWPQWLADADALNHLSHGRSVAAPSQLKCPLERLAIVDEQGRLRGLAEVVEGPRIAPKRWLADPDRGIAQSASVLKS